MVTGCLNQHVFTMVVCQDCMRNTGIFPCLKCDSPMEDYAIRTVDGWFSTWEGILRF
jgi:hypothetical protein